MAESLLQYAPPDFVRVLQGIAIPPERGGDPDQDENARMFAMANFIYAALDKHSVDWTDYTSSSSPYVPATPSSHTLEDAEAHIPSYLRKDARANGGIPDERLAEAVRVALPSVQNIFSRPFAALPEMGIWSCPECGHTIDPWDLKVDESVTIASYLGVGVDCGVVVAGDGRTQLDSANPWQFGRSVDCLGWTHFAEHLSAECINFWFPSPASAYKSAPGLWWNEWQLTTRQAYKPLLLEIEAMEGTAKYNFRMWKFKKMLGIANKGWYGARFELTRWRREAVGARERLVRSMFEAGRSIIDTGLALVHKMDEQQNDPVRLRLQGARDEARQLRREWLDRRERWARMYLGN